MIEPIAPDPSPAGSRETGRIRVLGAGIAAGLALAILSAAWTLAHAIDRQGAVGLEAVLGLRGIAGGRQEGQILAWAAGPLAAAIAGAVVAPSLGRHRARNGANMGTLTYVVGAVLLGWLLVVGFGFVAVILAGLGAIGPNAD